MIVDLEDWENRQGDVEGGTPAVDTAEPAVQATAD